MDSLEESTRDCRPSDQRARPQQHDFPLRQLARRVEHTACKLTLVGTQFDDDGLLLRCGVEEHGVDARGDDPVIAGEALLGGHACLLGQSDQRIEPSEELLAL